VTLFSGILAEPTYLLIWLFWLIAVNSAALFFLQRIEARWILATWLINAVLMTALAELNGYNRFLGLSHVVAWTPLLVYLWRRRGEFEGSSLVERWIRVLFVTNLISLVIDYVDVGRYLLGGMD
jgi:hypothetical protein